MALDKDKFVAAQRTSGAEWVQSVPLLWSLVSDEPFTFDKLGPYYKYDPAAAKKLLIEAGFADGKVSVATTLLFAVPSHTARATVVQTLWKSEGISLEIQASDFATYSPYYYLRSHQDVTLAFQNTGDFSLNWYAQNKFSANANQNSAYINDSEIEKAVKAIKTTTDAAQLRQFARQLWDFDTLGAWNIWLPAERSYAVVAPRVRNYTVRAGNTYTGGAIIPWLTDAPRTSP